MAGFTRKTHIVRIKQPILDSGQTSPMYVDVEVLDAIAYRTTNGNVHVWKCPSSEADPYILDTTGDTPDWSKGGVRSTRGSHAKQIVDPAGVHTGQFDIEVLDRIAFQDDGGQIWCLDCPDENSAPFCVTDRTGNEKSTRRTHLELIEASSETGGTAGAPGAWFGPGKNGAQPSIVVERVDMIGFTGADEKKLVIKMESHDDGEGARANTFCTPENYDPTTQSGSADVPDNTDPNLYFKFFRKFTPPQTVHTINNTFGWSGTASSSTPPGHEGFFLFSGVFISEAAAQEDINLFSDFFSIGGFLLHFAPGSRTVFKWPDTDVTFPGSTQTVGIDTGGINDDPTKTVKVSMGPLWWIRAIHIGGAPVG